MRYNIETDTRVDVPDSIRLNTFGYIPDDAYVWWDAADASTITIDVGVSELRDKGSAGFNLIQPDAAHQPDYDVIQQNYLPVISFDRGAQEQLYVIESSLGIDNAAVSVAFRPIDVGKSYQSILSYSGDTNDFQFDANDGSDWLGRFNSQGYLNQNFSNTPLTGVAQILTIVGDVAKGTLDGYLNEDKIWSNSGYTGWDNTDVAIRLAVNRGNERFLTCDFYEMVVTRPEDAADLIEYLMAKWNI